MADKDVKTLSKKEVKELIEEHGWVQVHVIFEMVGNPKEHIVSTLKNYLATIASEESIKLVKEDFATPEKDKELWSVYAEVDYLIKDLTQVTWLVFNYMPASIEFIKPQEYDIKARELQDWVNDLLAKLHEVNMVAKQSSVQRQSMSNTLGKLAMNVILYGVDNGMKVSEIAKKFGMRKEDVLKFGEILVKEGKITINKDAIKRKK